MSPIADRTAHPADDVQRLSIQLAGTAARRAARADELQALAHAVDQTALMARLAGARLLPLLGARFVELAPDIVSDDFKRVVDETTTHARRRTALVEQVALRLVTGLEEQGLTAVALKGPHLAERLHGDASMRSSNDIDLLVQPEDFHRTVTALEARGYRSENKAPWLDGLPLFEASLLPAEDWSPPIDLHWRLHWYEETYSRQFIGRAQVDERAIRAPGPLDELSALLLFWARDGLMGLRHAADVSAWWDRHGTEIAPRALEGVAAAHPRLRPVLTAAALHADRLLGVPSAHLLGPCDDPARRLLLASRCAFAARPATESQREAAITVVDALLIPRGGGSAFLRRHLVLPEAVIADVYRLPERARLRRTLRRAYYAARVGGELAAGSAGLLRRVRTSR